MVNIDNTVRMYVLGEQSKCVRYHIIPLIHTLYTPLPLVLPCMCLYIQKVYIQL